MASFSDLMEKIGRQEALSPTEQAELLQHARSVEEARDAVKSWLPAGSTNPKFNEVSARRIDLDVPVGNPFFVYNDGLTDINVPKNTYYPLNFESAIYTVNQDRPCVIRTSGSKIYANYKNAFINVFGRILWENNSNGERTIEFNYYNSADALIDSRPLDVKTADVALGTINTIAANCPSISSKSTDPGQYFQIEVYQTSGASLYICMVDLKFSIEFK